MTTSSPGVAQVGGLTFNDTDANGVEWAFDAIDGWHDGPSVEVEQVQRIISHGQFRQPGRRGGRVITLSGWVYSASRLNVSAAADSLTALLADGSSDVFTFIDADAGVRWAEVQLLATPDIAWDTNKFLFRYQLQLLASDSYRYGSTSSASTGFASDPAGVGAVFPAFPDGLFDFGDVASGDVGIVTVHNFGTATASPLFSISGPAPTGGFQIIELVTGNSITYLGDLPVGSVLVIDPRDASAVIDGVADRSGDVIVTGGWPSVPRESDRDYLFQPSGGSSAAVLTVNLISTFW